MTDVNPEDVLEEFLYENIFNRQERYEDEGWRISYATPNFLLADPDGNIINIKVVFEPGDLSDEEIETIIADQEWDQYDY